MSKYLKYTGSDYILGEIVKDAGIYWLVRRLPTKQDPKQRLVCHPKWATQIIEEKDLHDYL